MCLISVSHGWGAVHFSQISRTPLWSLVWPSVSSRTTGLPCPSQTAWMPIGGPVPVPIDKREAASGGRDWDRPELHRMLDQLGEGDTVVVWKLDRLSRSLKDVLHIMERIAEADAGFRSITENIDTTTPAGRMMMQMVGSFAESERARSASAHRPGSRPRAEGTRRRPKLNATQRADIAENVMSGRRTAAQMARLYKVSELRWSLPCGQPGGPVKLIPGSSSCLLDRSINLIRCSSGESRMRTPGVVKPHPRVQASPQFRPRLECVQVDTLVFQ